MSDLNSLEDIFEGEKTAPATPETKPAEQPQPEAQPAQQPEATAEQPRDGNGRFAPKVEQPAQAAPVEQPQTAPQPTQQKPLIDADQFKGYLEEREKRQAAEARAAKAEAEAKAMRERVEQQNAQPAPSFIDDPEAYAAHIQHQIYLASLGSKFDTSEVLARQTHGDDAVQAAMQWGMEKSDPAKGGNLAFRDQYAAQRHPVDWIVKQYKRDQLLSQIGDKDPLEWAKELLAQQQSAAPQNPQAATPAPPQPAPAATPPPTPSLASATSAGGINAVVDPGLKSLEQIIGN